MSSNLEDYDIRKGWIREKDNVIEFDLHKACLLVSVLMC